MASDYSNGGGGGYACHLYCTFDCNIPETTKVQWKLTKEESTHIICNTDDSTTVKR